MCVCVCVCVYPHARIFVCRCECVHMHLCVHAYICFILVSTHITLISCLHDSIIFVIGSSSFRTVVAASLWAGFFPRHVDAAQAVGGRRLLKVKVGWVLQLETDILRGLACEGAGHCASRCHLILFLFLFGVLRKPKHVHVYNTIRA